MDATLKHLGPTERILAEEKDYRRELEDIPDLYPFKNTTPVEAFLSVNEQIRNVLNFKNLSNEDKLYKLLLNQFNPFLEPNFNNEQLAYASTN